MFRKSGLFLLLVTLFQVYAEYVTPDFIENVIASQSKEEPETRIVSGWPASPGQHPHQASLRMVSATGSVGGCGGSIVSKEWVITAAHCTALRVTLVVRGGLVSLTTPEYIFETTEWYDYPTYDTSQPSLVQINDISIVKVPRPFVYSPSLQRIRVQSSADANKNYDGERVYASGFGRTWSNGAVSETLNWVYLRAVSNPSCQQTFGSELIIDSSICARFYNVTSQSTCQGDSGGPLAYLDVDDILTLIGVTSFVAAEPFGCHSGIPAGFIRPGHFHSWFQKVTGIDFENLREEEDATDPPEIETTTEPWESEEVTDEPGSGETPEPPESEETTEPPTSEESDEDSEDSDEDEELSELLKRLEVQVKVKVKLNKYKIKKEVEKDKEIKKKH